MSSIKKTDNFFLIDGSGYIFRAYYALPPLSRKSDGMPTGAVSGFCNMLYKLLEDVKSGEGNNKATHFAVIFDSARKNFRNKIYSEYKANRSEAPEDLVPQFEYIRKSVEAFNLPSIEMINYEADDLIATYVDQILKKGARVTIVSSDKDLMQLIKPGVKLYDPIKNKFLGLKEVKDKFGVEPNKVVDVQALAGDSSDNVPGIPSIGVKTAAELINKYKSLDQLLKKANEISQKKRKETLIKNKEKAILSRKLVELKKDVIVESSIETFTLKKIDKEKLFKFLSEMEFNRLLSKAIADFGEPDTGLNNEQKFKNKAKFDLSKYQTITKIEELEDWIEKIERKGLVVIDVETTSLNPHEADLVGISLCVDTGDACYIPFEHEDKKNVNAGLILKKLKPCLEDPSIKKIGQNIKFDFIVLYRKGINMHPMDDTMLMSYVLDAGKHRHNMDNLSQVHLEHKTISFKEITGTGKKQINFSEVSTEAATKYSGEDADVTYRLYDLLSNRLKNEKLVELYEVLEKPMIKLLAQMESNGIKIDVNFLINLSKKFGAKIKDIEKKIFQVSKKEFNIGSPKQLGEILYNELKLSDLKKTKKGSFATSALVLEDLAYKGHKLPSLVLDWRQLTKLKNTYTDALPKHLSSKTERIHTSFLLAATTTGRLASSEPNLQNIPIKSEDGKQIRKAFIADNENILISADYNQIEMRILADLADVKQLKKAFVNQEDVHSLTASQVFNIPLNKIDKEIRRKAKAINFGIIYGISQYGLAKQLLVSNQEANEFLKSCKI